jgi:hypothetical protein
VRRDEIEAVFGDGWRIDEIAPATMEVAIDPRARAWRASVIRT